MRESFEEAHIKEIEGRLMAEFPGGVLESKEDGDGYEMMIKTDEGRKETYYLSHADEEEARRLHEFAARMLKDQPGLAGDAGYIWHEVEKERRKGSVH